MDRVSLPPLVLVSKYFYVNKITFFDLISVLIYRLMSVGNNKDYNTSLIVSKCRVFDTIKMS